MSQIRTRLARGFVAGTLALCLASSAGVALAATAPAPGTGATGACNMLAAWGAGANGGMAHAMTVDNANGNTGMFGAVAASGAVSC
jgi:hypothetical protein